MNLTVSDTLLILGAFLGPVLAVQVQKYLERLQEKNGRKLMVFRTLMATRGARTSLEHVQALNMIDIEFNKKNRREKLVIDAWESYLAHLSKPIENNESEAIAANRSQKMDDLFFELIYNMSCCLRYDFTKTQVQEKSYNPNAHVWNDRRRFQIELGLAQILSGEKPLKMAVESFPVSEEALRKQTQLQDALIKALEKGPLSVVLESDTRCDKNDRSRETQ